MSRSINMVTPGGKPSRIGVEGLASGSVDLVFDRNSAVATVRLSRTVAAQLADAILVELASNRVGAA